MRKETIDDDSNMKESDSIKKHMQHHKKSRVANCLLRKYYLFLCLMYWDLQHFGICAVSFWNKYASQCLYAYPFVPLMLNTYHKNKDMHYVCIYLCLGSFLLSAYIFLWLCSWSLIIVPVLSTERGFWSSPLPYHLTLIIEVCIKHNQVWISGWLLMLRLSF